jgi:hypothetical protein
MPMVEISLLMTEQLPLENSSCPDEGRLQNFISIADIAISLATDDPGLEPQVRGALEKFVVAGADPDVQIRAAWAELSTVNGGEKIFDSGGLWQLYVEDNDYRFCFFSPVFGSIPYKEARFNTDFSYGEIVLHRPYFTSGRAPYALEYPLDELMVMHLLARGRGAEVHSCGVVDVSGNGHLFLGQSGAGKTTLARLWQKEEGVRILSDDRVVLRKMDGRFWMYGTPWHGDARLAEPSRAPLKGVYFLHHGEKNRLVLQKKAGAVGRLFACSFPPFYSPEALEFTLAFFEEVVQAVPCTELSFVPDEEVVKFILGSKISH